MSPHIVQYIINNAFGKYKEEWVHHKSKIEFVHYYWDGLGGQMMLGVHRYIVLALALAALALAWKRVDRFWRFVAAYLIVLAALYAVPTMISLDNPFFAADADVLILLAGALLLAGLLDQTNGLDGFRGIARATAWVALFLSLMSFRGPVARYDRGDHWSEVVNRLGQQIYNVICDHPGSHNSRVFFTAPGPVDDMLLRYNALINGRNFVCPNLHVTTDLDPYRQEIDRADFVVASEPGNGVTYESMVGARLEQPALEMARARADLEEIARLPALNGKVFVVFARRSLSEADEERVKQLPFDNPWAPLYRQ
jgi:hypothetical protein